MSTLLLAASADGMAVCEREAEGWREIRRGLDDQYVTSVIAREGVILAGTKNGVYRSDDLGASWREASQGLGIRYVRWLAYHPDESDFEYAGTEPAGIFVSHDGAQSWRGCPEVAELRREYGWYLPYSPEAGCVRGLAVHGERAYAAVEDGCVLVSRDKGETWQLAPGSRGRPDHTPPEAHVHSDVHSIAVHPSSAEFVAAPTGGGFYCSTDGGATWTPRYERCYVRAVWLDPQDRDHMILGPADGVDRNGRIEETSDGGRSWNPASRGMHGIPWRSYMVERFSQVGDELLAVLSNGELHATRLEALAWRRVLPALSRVTAVAALEN